MALFKPEFGLIFWMLVVFLIILGILAKYAWPMIIRSIEDRADFIDKGVEYAREAVRQRDEAKEQARMLLEEAHKQQIDALQETERMRQKILEEARENAQVEARKVMEKARLSIEQSKREAELQVKKEVSRLALDITGKLLRKNLESDEAQKELIDKMLEEIE